MQETLHLEIVTPEMLAYEQEVIQVDIPGTSGDLGVLPRHAPMIVTVRPGVVTVFVNKQTKQCLFITGGVAEITPDRCTILATALVDLDKADKQFVLKQQQDIEHALKIATKDDEIAKLQHKLDELNSLLRAL